MTRSSLHGWKLSRDHQKCGAKVPFRTERPPCSHLNSTFLNASHLSKNVEVNISG